jgi:hypothetical protein
VLIFAALVCCAALVVVRGNRGRRSIVRTIQDAESFIGLSVMDFIPSDLYDGGAQKRRARACTTARALP